MIAAGIDKKWIAQATVNMGDDEELLSLAHQAGCVGVFIGFESPTAEGLDEVGKKFNLLKGRDLRTSVRRIQRHKILVCGSFIMGLDADRRGIGRRIADAGHAYGVDVLNVLFLTPLPGTRLWDTMQAEGRIDNESLPEDWRYYTLTFPVAKYKQLSRQQIIREMEACDRRFYSPWRIFRRVWGSLWSRRQPFFSLLTNLAFRGNIPVNRRAYQQFARVQRSARRERRSPWRGKVCCVRSAGFSPYLIRRRRAEAGTTNKKKGRASRSAARCLRKRNYFTMSFSALSGRTLMTLRAGLALNICSCFVKGLMPL